jgi:hypothetical protein
MDNAFLMKLLYSFPYALFMKFNTCASVRVCERIFMCGVWIIQWLIGIVTRRRGEQYWKINLIFYAHFATIFTEN